MVLKLAVSLGAVLPVELLDMLGMVPVRMAWGLVPVWSWSA